MKINEENETQIPKTKKGYFYKRCISNMQGNPDNPVKDTDGTYIVKTQGWLFDYNGMQFAAEKDKRGWNITDVNSGIAVLMHASTKEKALLQLMGDERISQSGMEQALKDYEKQKGNTKISDDLKKQADIAFIN